VNSADQVAKIIELLKIDGVPLSDAAWQTALACVGYPYVFGAWGEECTPANRKRRVRDDHPTIVSKCQVLSGKKSDCAGCQWFPDGCRVRMFDCRGFTDWVLKQFGIDLKGEGATSQWNTESNWKAKGTIDTIPDDILVCLFVKDGAKMSHTGFGYKGETCECSSGVQHFTKRNKKWSHWAIPNGIDGDIPDYKPTLRRGDKGEYVTLAQTELLQKGYDLGKCGVDGSFGAATEKAVRQFQKDAGLVQDGIIGQKTWTALENTSPTLYTVTIPHLSASAADALCNQYAGATKTEEGR
jgi:hypothetical protein